MKVYKGFSPDMTCRDFHFKEGETYQTQSAILGKTGFHAGTKPTDAFEFYPPCSSVYHEAEMDIKDSNADSSRVCSDKITVGKRLDINDMIKAEYAKAVEQRRYYEDGLNPEHQLCRYVHPNDRKNDAYSGHHSVSFSNRGRAITGDRSIAIAGDQGLAISKCNSISTTDAFGVSFCEDNGKAVSGYFGISIGRGPRNTCITGNNGVIVNHASYNLAGKNSVIVINRGSEAYVKAGLGSLIVTMTGRIHTWKIDGKKYKSDTWYKISYSKDGKPSFKEHAVQEE